MDYEKAAIALRIVNSQEARLRPFDAARESQQKEAFPKLFAQNKQQIGTATALGPPIPIFVIGLPRSGITLVEQILTAHGDITGFGELASAGRLAVSAFPEARFVCLKRDPSDVALSMWRSHFPNRSMDYTFDLVAVAQVTNNFGDYMAHSQKMFGD